MGERRFPFSLQSLLDSRQSFALRVVSRCCASRRIKTNYAGFIYAEGALPAGAHIDWNSSAHESHIPSACWNSGKGVTAFGAARDNRIENAGGSDGRGTRQGAAEIA